jgi:hypothetical protein
METEEKQMAPPLPITSTAKLSLKEKLKAALRKTGHVSEEALDAVATVAIEATTGLGETER